MPSDPFEMRLNLITPGASWASQRDKTPPKDTPRPPLGGASKPPLPERSKPSPHLVIAVASLDSLEQVGGVDLWVAASPRPGVLVVDARRRPVEAVTGWLQHLSERSMALYAEGRRVIYPQFAVFTSAKAEEVPPEWKRRAGVTWWQAADDASDLQSLYLTGLHQSLEELYSSGERLAMEAEKRGQIADPEQEKRPSVFEQLSPDQRQAWEERFAAQEQGMSGE